jgi:chromosome segregation ATPase
MRSKESMLRLHRFKVEDKRRQVAEIEYMISDMQAKVAEFNQQIELEEKRTGVTDINHFNYSTTAKSIRVRGDNIQKSVVGLQDQLAVAQQDLEEEESELRKIELLAQKSGVKLSGPEESPAPMPGIGVRI